MLEENLKEHVQILSSQIGERNVFYYKNLIKAQDYIYKKFNELGYKTVLQPYYVEGKQCNNIIAEKKGSINPQQIVIVGAHYDSVWGSPGADDNASGVACLLELARLFSQKTTNKTIKFIAFVNEEPPFFLTSNMGSQVYVKEAKKNKENIIAMLCLESIGYYSNKRNSQGYPVFLKYFYPDKANFIGVVGNFHSRQLVYKVKKMLFEKSQLDVQSIVGIGILVPAIEFSDNSSFWRQGYKAVMITDTAFYRNPNYHTIQDTPDTLNYPAIAKLTRGLYYMLLELVK